MTPNPPTTTDHRPYIERVVHALNDAGLTVQSWRAGHRPPRPSWQVNHRMRRTAHIELDCDICRLVLAWDEEAGWSWGWDEADQPVFPRFWKIVEPPALVAAGILARSFSTRRRLRAEVPSGVDSALAAYAAATPSELPGAETP